MTCGRKLGPYDCCSVVCGHCLELMKALPDGCVDAVITDPPYGANKAEWDSVYPQGFESSALRVSHLVGIMPGQWALRDCMNALGEDYCGIIAARNMNGMAFSPIGFGNWIPVVIAGHVKSGMDAFEFSIRGAMPNHPSPKPIEMMMKLVDRLSDVGQTILDPFLGSVTTAVAAKKLGRHFLGFEISEAYCAIARERIALVEAQPNLFDKPKITQAEFEDLAL